VDKNHIFIGLVIFLIIGSINVLAIGISPGRTVLHFEPGQKHTINFHVINNERKDMDVLLMVGDSELKSIVSLSDSAVSFSEEEESKEFSYGVKMPGSIDKPGDHEILIIAQEVSKKDEKKTVGATAAVASLLKIRVPYPGKYAEAKLDVSEAKSGENVTFVVSVRNLGKEDIKLAKATIDIFDPNNKKVASLTTKEKSVKVKDKIELVVRWEADVDLGRYNAVAKVVYDGKTIRTEKSFTVGNIFIDILKIVVNDFQLGDIAKFNFFVENKWNELIKSVIPQIVIIDKEGEEVSSEKGAGVDVDALSRAELVTYWDTKYGVEEGVYDGKAILYYEDKITEKQLKTDIRLNSMTVSFLGETGMVVGEGGIGRKSIFVVLIIILTLVNISWFVYMRKRGKMFK